MAGSRAAAKIKPSPDVLVVGRGGGSIEDLWAFNEEPVVRAIAASPLPTVSAVGHEVDVTLADLAADVRAATPSEAAERVVPAAEELSARLRTHADRLHTATRRYTHLGRTRLEAFASQRVMRRPFELLHDLSRRLDELSTQATSSLCTTIAARRAEVAALAGKLDSLSPLGVLERGYSITTNAKTGRLVRRAAQLKPGQRIATRFADGSAESEVENVSPAR